MTLRKTLIIWSAYRNLVGYPALIAWFAYVTRLHPDFHNQLLLFCVIAPGILITFHTIISAIESVVMRLQGYCFASGFLGRGEYSPYWVHKQTGERKYVLVSVDGHSDPDLT